jgi:glycine cleavage system H protein
MDAIVNGLGAIGIFVTGLLVRLLVFAAVIAAVTLVVLVAIGGVEGVAAIRRAVLGVTRVGSLAWRPDARYAPGHTWVARGRGRRVRLGLDDLAQRLLPSDVRVRLPQVGGRVERGAPVVTIRADGQEVAVVSPVTGLVARVNRRVARDPTLIHRDPYVRGWLVEVVPADAAHEGLPAGEPARRWLAAEGVRLERLLEQVLGYAVADGGELLLPAHRLLRSGEWRRVTEAFLARV